MLLSFHNDKKIKTKYVNRLKAHAKADNIIQGQTWSNGKGCAVGCTLENYSHSAYETELGLPEWLAKLEDILFEGLPNKDAKKFAVEFLLAIPIGKDLTKVKWQFASFVLAENLKRVKELGISEQLKKQVSEAIRGSKAVNDKAAKTGIWDESAESAARSAARSAESAAWSAESAAWSAESAARSAESAARSAESAAWSAARSAESAARSAESAAWSAARSAESAAWSAAWSAAYKCYTKHLLKLLKEAK